METTTVYWGNIGRMEKKMATTTVGFIYALGRRFMFVQGCNRGLYSSFFRVTLFPTELVFWILQYLDDLLNL